MLRSTAAAAALLSPHLNLQSSLWIDIKKLELADIFPKDLWVFCTHRQLVPCEKEAFNSALFGNDSKRHFLFFSCRLTRKIPRIPFCLLAFARSNFTLWEKKWAKNTTWRSPFGRLRNGAFFHPQRALNGITIKAVPNPWKNGSNPQEIHFLSLVFVSLPSSSWLFWEFCTTKSRRWYKRYKTCRKRRNRWMEIYSGKKTSYLQGVPVFIVFLQTGNFDIELTHRRWNQYQQWATRQSSQYFGNNKLWWNPGSHHFHRLGHHQLLEANCYLTSRPMGLAEIWSSAERSQHSTHCHFGRWWLKRCSKHSISI